MNRLAGARRGSLALVLGTMAALLAFAGQARADVEQRTFPSAIPLSTVNEIGFRTGTFIDGPGGSPATDCEDKPFVVPFQVSGLDLPLAHVSLGMEWGRGNVGHFVVVLVSPHGRAHTIFARTGLPPDGFGDSSDLDGTYTFSDRAPASPTWWEAAQSVGPSAPVPPGAYRASVPGGFPNPPPGFGNNTLITPTFTGQDPDGTWQLQIGCEEMIGAGELFDAALTLEAAVGSDEQETASDKCEKATKKLKKAKKKLKKAKKKGSKKKVKKAKKKLKKAKKKKKDAC